MGSTTSFQEQLSAINSDLRSSLERLQELLGKTLADMDTPEVRYNPAEREHLEQVVKGLEEKISEIRSIGLANP